MRRSGWTVEHICIRPRQCCPHANVPLASSGVSTRDTVVPLACSQEGFDCPSRSSIVVSVVGYASSGVPLGCLGKLAVEQRFHRRVLPSMPEHLIADPTTWDTGLR